MGYLNNQLEKVASAVTVGMEKKALKIADLIRMGKDAVNRGKALHFSKRLAQRNRALANNKALRRARFNQAYANLNDAAELELTFGKVGPNKRELWRLDNRIPRTGSDTINELTKITPNTTIPSNMSAYYETPRDYARALLSRPHAQVSAEQLSKIVTNLRRGWGNALI